MRHLTPLAANADWTVPDLARTVQEALGPAGLARTGQEALHGAM